MDYFGLFLRYHKEVADSKLKTIDRFQKGLQEQPIKRTSMFDVVEQVLIKARRPLHISEIIKIADRDFGAHLDGIPSFLLSSNG